MADGMKITLTGIGSGLTRSTNGQELLPRPFVFQCPPIDEFKLVHAFNFGNYDTINEGQYSRWGSRQLATWQFDTLAMYLAVADDGRQFLFERLHDAAVELRIAKSSHNSDRIAAASLQFQNAYSDYQQAARFRQHDRQIQPSWVPFPNPTSLTRTYDPKYTPMWYVSQLRALHNAGAPFRFEAKFAGADVPPALSTLATLTGFSEGHKAGEGDAIYLEGVSFQQWRDPSGKQHPNKHGISFPVPVLLRTDDSLQGFGAYAPGGIRIPAHGPSTLAQVARRYYHNPSDWRVIAKANSVRHGNANTQLQKLYPFDKTNFKVGKVRFLTVPQLPAKTAKPKPKPKHKAKW